MKIYLLAHMYLLKLNKKKSLTKKGGGQGFAYVAAIVQTWKEFAQKGGNSTSLRKYKRMSIFHRSRVLFKSIEKVM